MLIKIDIYWINSNSIALVYDAKCRTTDGGKTHLPDSVIKLMGMPDGDGSLFINDKTADEVAAEINRQTAGE